MQVSYGSNEFTAYKQKAAEYAVQVNNILKRMGVTGYIEDSGFRGYHVWVFFTEWIPVRYLNQFTDCVIKEWNGIQDDIVLEVFPDSSRIRPGKFGQRVKLPLGVHIRTGSRSFFLDEQFHTVSDYREFFSGIARYSLSVVQRILGIYAVGVKENTAVKEVD